MMPISGLTIIIPAYNEADSLPGTISSVYEELRRSPVDYELILIDDGSTDGTKRIIEAIAAGDERIRAVFLPTNQGKGAALRAGFALACKEWIIFLDADGQIDFSQLSDLLPLTTRNDMVIGYRTERSQPLWRWILSRCYRILTKRFLGVSVRDVGCPFKLFRMSMLSGYTFRSQGLIIDAELLQRARSVGCSIAECAVRSHARTRGTSSVRLIHVREALRELRKISGR